MWPPLGVYAFSVVAGLSSVVVASIAYVWVRRFVSGQFQAVLRKCCDAKPGRRGRGVRGSPLYAYNEALPYLRGNPFITHGYRQEYSLREALQSLCTVHNETANIWSHLLGFLLFAYFTLSSAWDLMVAEAAADPLHQVAVMVFCWGAASLLACSTTFHWFGCLSDEVYMLTAKLDYTGIAILILTSFFPFMYSLFWCKLGWGLFYSACITLLTVLAIYVSWSEKFSKPGYHWLRAGLFIGVGLFGGVPMPHATLALGLERSWPVLWPLLLMGALYIGGAVLYAMHIPERWFPGKFNAIGHSHFIFHCCVVCAACLHYWNVHRLIAWRQLAMPTCAGL